MITGMMARRIAAAGETDPYWSDVFALLPFDTATNQEVSGNSVWIASPGTIASATTMLDGSYAVGIFKIQTNDLYSIAARDFTIEFWLRPTDFSSDYQTIFFVPGSAIYYRLGKLNWYQGGVRCESAALTIGVTYAVLISRQSGTVRLFVNGIKSVSDYAGSASITTSRIYIGTNSFGDEASNCEIDEMRITLDVARETANYTPRTTPFPRS
jgi:hypothetical protein